MISPFNINIFHSVPTYVVGLKMVEPLLGAFQQDCSYFSPWFASIKVLYTFLRVESTLANLHRFLITVDLGCDVLCQPSSLGLEQIIQANRKVNVTSVTTFCLNILRKASMQVCSILCQHLAL